MKIKHQWFVFFSLITIFSFSANAQIYKWTDKDGVVRYTDTPPPSSVKNVKTIGNNKPTVNQVKPEAVAAPVEKGTSIASPISKDDMAHDAEAKKRQQLIDMEKQKKAQQEAEAKQNAANCTAARANYQTYSQGGRVYETNEKGERVYLDDGGLSAKASQAQREIQQYCK
jgi:hypothetical protein